MRPEAALPERPPRSAPRPLPPGRQAETQHVATAAAAATNVDMQHAPSATAASVGQGWSMEAREEEKQVNAMPTRRKLPIGPKATTGGKSDRPQGEILVQISLNFPLHMW